MKPNWFQGIQHNTLFTCGILLRGTLLCDKFIKIFRVGMLNFEITFGIEVSNPIPLDNNMYPDHWIVAFPM